MLPDRGSHILSREDLMRSKTERWRERRERERESIQLCVNIQEKCVCIYNK